MTGGRLLWVREDLALLAIAAPDDQARSATRDELLGELARTGHLVLDRPLTSTGVAAALMADPDLALQVLDQLRVADPWGRQDAEGHSWARWDARDIEPDVSSDPPGYVYREPLTGRWDASCCEVDIDDDYATAEEVMAAVDAALVAAGWALAGQAESEREVEDATAMDRQAERETP